MKDLIKYCMTQHEAEIQKLEQTALGKERFGLFIRRWEMNCAPPPEESTPDKYVISHVVYTILADLFLFCHVRSHDRAWSGPGRLLDLAEEDYFNAEDEDDNVIPSISQQSWLKDSPLSSNNTGMKRKRRPGISSAPKGYRPPLKTPQLGALVDYGEDDDELNTTTDADNLPQSSGSRSVSPDTKTSAQIKRPPSPASTPTPPSSVQLSGPPPKRVVKDENDEDNILEALVRNPRSRPQSPLPGLGPMRPAEKRRRVEDDDDELFARLSKAPKKSDLGNQKESATSIPGRAKNGDDPPGKKIKVRLGTVGLAVATAPVPEPTIAPGTCSPSSEGGTKDGDTG